jgi:hypothetical protein
MAIHKDKVTPPIVALKPPPARILIGCPGNGPVSQVRVRQTRLQMEDQFTWLMNLGEAARAELPLPLFTERFLMEVGTVVGIGNRNIIRGKPAAI